LNEAVSLAVTDPSRVGEARRAATALARQVGFDDTGTGKVALVVTELGTNLIKHAGGGAILLRSLEDGTVNGIEVLALDRGPGMTDVARCRSDGFSTAGSPGTGLGAVARQSSFVDVYSTPQTGTALLARLWTESSQNRPTTRWRLGAVTVPHPNEMVCGDAWGTIRDGARCLFLVADGLGHGPLAADAANTALRVFLANTRLGPAAVLQVLHDALRGTRGAAVAVAEADLDAQVLRFAGVGNIAGCVVADGNSRCMLSHNGTVGHEARKFQELSYPFPSGALLIMHSDGLGSRWDLGRYPGLAGRDPALVAGVLYRDFARGHDDVTIVAAQEERSGI
jgi:anti-sigma regulatory factor (Ser/Thr protein kinase)